MRKMLWLLLMPVAAFAETAYVTDTLRLGLHMNDLSAAPIL